MSSPTSLWFMTPNGALHYEHCTSLTFAPLTSTSSISNVALLQSGQFDICSPIEDHLIPSVARRHLFPHQFWQRGDICRYPQRLVLAEQLGSRSPAELLLVIDIGQFLPIAVPDDEAREHILD